MMLENQLKQYVSLGVYLILDCILLLKVEDFCLRYFLHGFVDSVYRVLKFRK